VPDTGGKFTPEEKTKATEWVNRHWEGRPQNCPICGSTRWVVGEHLVQPLTVSGPHFLPLLGGAVGYPQIQVISIPCGYTMLINAVVAGVVPGIPEPPKTTEPEKK
jgi:hypothetical protein